MLKAGRWRPIRREVSERVRHAAHGSWLIAHRKAAPHKRNPEGASAEASALSGFLFRRVQLPFPFGTTEATFRSLRSLASRTSPFGSG